MKKLVAIILTVFSISSYSFDLSELEAILTAHGTNVEQLKEDGVGVVLGELTGIGMTIDAGKLEALIAKNDLIFKKDILKTNFAKKPGKKKIGDIKSIQLVNGELIKIQQAKGALVRR